VKGRRAALTESRAITRIAPAVKGGVGRTDTVSTSLDFSQVSLDRRDETSDGRGRTCEMEYLSPAQAAKLWPRPNTHFSVVLRAFVTGKASKMRPGERIRCKAIRDTQGWFTTAEWVQEFFAELTRDRGGSVPNTSVKDRAQRARERLAANGFWK
jgi:hypothetical protein